LPSGLPIFLATDGAVFVAEIVGDKLLYTTGVLAAHYRTVPIMEIDLIRKQNIVRGDPKPLGKHWGLSHRKLVHQSSFAQSPRR